MQAALKDPDREKYRPGQMDFVSASEEGSSEEEADSEEEEVGGRLACGSHYDPHLSPGTALRLFVLPDEQLVFAGALVWMAEHMILLILQADAGPVGRPV